MKRWLVGTLAVAVWPVSFALADVVESGLAPTRRRRDVLPPPPLAQPAGGGVPSSAMLSRRRFVGTLSASLLAAPCPGEAQQPRKATRIGFLSPSPLSDLRTRTFVEAFRQGLRNLGWVEGQNITIEYRWAEDRTERLRDLARDLARAKVELVVAATSPAVQAAKEAAQTIPIGARSRLPTMYGLTDYVKAGGLMAYGPDVADMYRRAATYVVAAVARRQNHRMTSTLAAVRCRLHRAQGEITRLTDGLPERICADPQTAT